MQTSLRAEIRAMLDAAGKTAMAHFGRVAAERKADGSVVTEADRVVEEALVGWIARAFPGESVVSEEGHRVDGLPGAPAWHVDPIDGTGAFYSGLAYWGPTVCRVVDGTLHVGGFYVPRLNEHWYGEAGGGAYRDEVRLGPTNPDTVPPDGVLFAPSRFHRRNRVPWPGKVRALGSSAAHMALVASGAGLVTMIPKWSLWDVGCGALLVQEAGRVIWGPTGAPVAVERIPPGMPFLAGAPAALQTLTAEGWTRPMDGRPMG